MSKKGVKIVLIELIFILISTAINAQLFEKNELYLNTKVIKGNYFNGCGEGKSWSLDYVDSLGRVVRKESYLKKRLLSREEIVYDNHNNKLFVIHDFDVNNPGRIDSNRFEYKYFGNCIVYQCSKYSKHDSIVIELIKNEGDSILSYQERSFYFRPNTGNTVVFKQKYNVIYSSGLLSRIEIFNEQENSKIIKSYEYYENGELKRRLIQRIPKPIIKEYYTGGPGSDDEYYKYKLDSKGRELKFYRIIDGKSYKIAVYHYVDY